MAPRAKVVERRLFDDYELRQMGDGEPIQFRGHAAIFNEMTTIGGAFRERVAPSAFDKALKDGSNVKFLYNHDEDSVMASVKTGALRLSVDDRGLLTEADLPLDDLDVQRLVPKIRRGDVDQMSFAFRAIQDDWDENPEDRGLPIRTLKELMLYDVSPVTFPAYEGTDAEALSETLAELSVRKLSEARPEVRKILEERSPLLKKDGPTGTPVVEDEQAEVKPMEVQPAIEQVPPQEPGEEPKVVEPEGPPKEVVEHPATEPSTPDEPSRSEHSLVEREQALMAQVLTAIERSLEV
jgi:HK97 family phage prohead protease